MSFPSITLKSIQNKATSKSFERGDQYCRSGSVEQVIQRGMVLQAMVEGSEPEAYRVTIPFDSGGITSARCSCAYAFDGWCKHIVAALLVCSKHPEQIEVRPSLDELLDRLDLNQTRQIICKLLADRPELVEALDFQVNSLITIAAVGSSKGSSKKVRQTSIDSEIYRRQVCRVLQDAVRDWENGRDDDSILDELGEVVEKADAFSEAGDGESAIAILEGITQGCVDKWDEVDEYGADNNSVVEMLDQAWAEAILTVDLTAEWQTELRSKLESWQQEWDCDFPIGMAALQQAWSHGPLVQVLQGEMTEFGAWDSEPPAFRDPLALVRLTILNRQERFQEYLHLAKAEGQLLQYWLMLVKVGRIEDAMSSAQIEMTSAEDAYALAKLLRSLGAIDQALEIAHLGLKFPVNRYSDFTQWTSDLAEGLNKPEFALEARVVAFRAGPSFSDYLKIQELSGMGWLELRQDLFKTLDQVPDWSYKDIATSVDIFLYEGLFDRAIGVVKKLTSYSYLSIQQVMDAVLSYSPDWVIETACHYAEDIMNSGKAIAYDQAVSWLQRAKASYEATGRQTEWIKYYQNLTQVHSRKRKLIGLLKTL